MSCNVVITGIGCVSPIGRRADEVCRNLQSRRGGVHPKRFDRFADPLWFGGAAQCDTSSQEGFATSDKALGFALAAAADALEEAGLTHFSGSADRAGVIVSSSKGLIGSLLAAGEAFRQKEEDFGEAFSRFSGDTPGRAIAAAHGFTGPVLNYPAACATGIASLVPAVNLLREGTVDLLLAGSTEASGIPLVLAGFASMGALSPGLSRPFHRERNGFNAGEGAAVFALEREEDARRRGARPLARIAGWDLRADGYSPTAIEPDGCALECAVRRTMERAQWSCREVEYINCHGTGTRLNDSVEALVLSRVFGSPTPLASSLKPYTGHLLGASASVELALALRGACAGFLPPTLHLDDPDPELFLNHVPPEGVFGPVRRLLKISQGFGGHIGVVAIEVLGGA